MTIAILLLYNPDIMYTDKSRILSCLILQTYYDIIMPANYIRVCDWSIGVTWSKFVKPRMRQLTLINDP